MGSSVNLNDIATKLSDYDANEHRDAIAKLLNRRTANFPGAQPVSFARKHLQELERTEYFMCEKTDGIRCLLYLHQWREPQGIVEAQFLIDRKNDVYHIPQDALHLPLEGNLGGSHTGTIIDGELVVEHYKDGRGDVLQFLIFDILCLDGTDITKRTLDTRLGKLRAFVYNPWLKFAQDYPQDAAAQPFQLRLKDMQPSYVPNFMFKEVIPKLRHGNDGLIFTCRTTPYQAGTDQHILKWKPPHENTIDFRLRIGEFPTLQDDDGTYEDWDAKPQMTLLVNKGGGDESVFADLHVTDAEWEAFKRMSESTGQILDSRIIECWRDSQTGQWRPKIEHHDGTPRFRDDKTEANHISTVKSVLESIEDAVSEQDLIRHSGRIRDAWKARERAQKEQQAREYEEKKRAAADDEGPGYD